jgi:hypothetical protein
MPLDLARTFAQEIIKIEANTTAVGVTGPEGTRVRENVGPQPTAQGDQGNKAQATVTHGNGGGNGKTKPHAQGASSQMARTLSGKAATNGHSKQASSKMMSWGNRYPYETDWIEVGKKSKDQRDVWKEQNDG